LATSEVLSCQQKREKVQIATTLRKLMITLRVAWTPSSFQLVERKIQSFAIAENQIHSTGEET